jgi:hypothetical protein
LAVSGVELPIKLRRGLGHGKVVPAEELARWIAASDGDKDGSVTRAELVQFLAKHHVGGPWFCEVVAKTLWRFVEGRLAKEVPSIPVGLLGRIIHHTMSAGPRPEKRYEITPEGMAGYKPLEPLNKPGDAALASARTDSAARPRATPRGATSSPQRSASMTPGRAQGGGGSPSRPQARRPGPRRPGPRR